MIDEKKIIDAADKYADETYAFKGPVPIEYKESIREIFKASIEWFKDNLLHEPKEEPSDTDGYNHIVLEWHENAAGRDKKRYSIIDNTYIWWKDVLKSYSIVERWFCIEDLMRRIK